MTNNDVMSDVQKTTDALDAIEVESILLGDIPVLDGDGLAVLGTFRQGNDYKWKFHPFLQSTPLAA